MMKYRHFELPPMDGQKSYYRKAWITEYEHGDIALTSYDTVVCKIFADGHFARGWGGYSRTTLRHINSFLRYYDPNAAHLSKATWEQMPVIDLRAIEMDRIDREIKRWRTME